MAERASTLIVGAGIVGSALAMHLAELGDPAVVCIDPDLAGARSSSELNAGGVRATWWQPVNVALCAQTIAFLADHADEVGFRPLGYLWLYGPRLWDGARAHLEMQNALGRDIEALDPADVPRRWPFIDRLEGIAGATFSPHDGLVNPNAVKELYRRRARAAGARFLDRRMLVGVERGGPGGRAVLRVLPDEDAALGALVGGAPTGDEERIGFERAVNAAGPWAGEVAATLGYRSPARAVRRQVALIASRDVDLSPYGMIVDTSGCYFHAEGELILAGYSPPGDPPGHDFRYEGRSFFEREIWPRLAARSTAMDRLEHVRGWAGLYELSPDGSAILGRVLARDDLFEIHSFSGRGVMQSHAAALALAELVVTGDFRTEDASALSAARFVAGRPQPEDLHI